MATRRSTRPGRPNGGWEAHTRAQPSVAARRRGGSNNGWGMLVDAGSAAGSAEHNAKPNQCGYISKRRPLKVLGMGEDSRRGVALGGGGLAVGIHRINCAAESRRRRAQLVNIVSIGNIDGRCIHGSASSTSTSSGHVKNVLRWIGSERLEGRPLDRKKEIKRTPIDWFVPFLA